jgi:hypothetical protein
MTTGGRARPNRAFRIERGRSMVRPGRLLLHDRFHRRFRNGAYLYPWYDGYYGDPSLYDDNGDPADYRSSYDDPGGSDDQQLQSEIERLQDQVSGLRAQRDSMRPPGTPADGASQSAPVEDVQAETVLVFRDRHTEQVQNYAIIGRTIWVFQQSRKTKIPLADLDIPATTKLNEDRGIDFRVPG